MNINGYLNSEEVTNEIVRKAFIEFVSEIEAIPDRKVLELERDMEHWKQMSDDFVEFVEK